jgi:hypothetical protein
MKPVKEDTTVFAEPFVNGYGDQTPGKQISGNLRLEATVVVVHCCETGNALSENPEWARGEHPVNY